MKIRKGDKVRVMAGKDKGRTVKVERVYKKQKKVLLPEINIYKKHVKKSDKLPQGGVVELPRPLEVSKVSFMCPKCKKTTRLGWRIDGKKKNRICKKCGEVV